MNYTLYGSFTSPFVRRIRLVLGDLPYTLKEVDVFNDQTAPEYKKINPLNQVPAFTDGDQIILDSRQIYNYLNKKHQFKNLTQNDENMLTIIEGAMGSAINLMIMRRSGINIDEPLMFMQRQKDRIETTLDYLKPYLEGKGKKDWDIISITLYAFFDWAMFRKIISFDQRPECLAFMQAHAERPVVLKTQIPKA